MKFDDDEEDDKIFGPKVAKTLAKKPEAPSASGDKADEESKPYKAINWRSETIEVVMNNGSRLFAQTTDKLNHAGQGARANVELLGPENNPTGLKFPDLDDEEVEFRK